jgi:formylglycine-generating enzyme required for sulfatase activity
MGSNPSYFKGDKLPVEQVSWNDVQEFIRKLNAMDEMEETDKYRLPSEAEWEYACRAGTTTRYSFGDGEVELGEHAWYADNAGDETHPVGQKKPNAWGLYDMHGNVWEWVQDEYHSNYQDAPSDGRAWDDGSSSNRVMRGGVWNYYTENCRSANRVSLDADYRDDFIGFRLLREM